MDVSPDAAHAAVAELRASRDAFNDAARAGVKPSELASPAEESCARCAFKPTCPYFYGEASAEWEWYRPSVLVQVGDLRQSGDATVLEGQVFAATSSRTPQVGNEILVVIPGEVQAEAGRVVAVSDARRPGQGPSITMSWDSTLAVWGSDVEQELAGH